MKQRTLKDSDKDYYRSVSGLLQALNIDIPKNAEEVTQDLLGYYAHSVNDIANQSSALFVPGDKQRLVNRILIYKGLKKRTEAQLDDLDFYISKDKTLSSPEKKNLQKLQSVLRNAQVQIAKFASERQMSQRHVQDKERNLILRRQKQLEQLKKLKKQKEKALKDKLNRNQQTDFVAKMLLPGMWFEEYKKNQKFTVEKMRQELSRISQKVEASGKRVQNNTKASPSRTVKKAPAKGSLKKLDTKKLLLTKGLAPETEAEQEIKKEKGLVALAMKNVEKVSQPRELSVPNTPVSKKAKEQKEKSSPQLTKQAPRQK